MSVVIVGESNPYGGTPEDALDPSPDGASGHRLMLIMGLRASTYRALRRVNLCAGEHWCMRDAKVTAAALLPTLSSTDVVVGLGTRVADAFNMRGFHNRSRLFTDDFLLVRVEELPGEIRVHSATYVCLPHPSGRCRAWSAPDAKWRARALLAKHAPDVPWGEAEQRVLEVAGTIDCRACRDEPDAPRGSCPCYHAPCVHDRNGAAPS